MPIGEWTSTLLSITISPGRTSSRVLGRLALALLATVALACTVAEEPGGSTETAEAPAREVETAAPTVTDATSPGETAAPATASAAARITAAASAVATSPAGGTALAATETGTSATAAASPAATPRPTPTAPPVVVSPAPTPTAAPATAQATSSPTAPPAVVSPAPTGSPFQLKIQVRPRPTGIPRYDRDEWRHWTDADGDCQDARQEVLIGESHSEVRYTDGRRCRVESGRWLGPYTGESFQLPRPLDVDHMVPLSNAHHSGGWAWDAARKEQYANDLSYPGHLIAVKAGANRSKGASGPEEWKPPLQSYWCQYAIDWIVIKDHWGLTATEREFGALAEMIETCESSLTLIRRSAPPVSLTTAPTSQSTAPSASPPADLLYDPAGPDRDCGDFDRWEQSQAFFLAAGGPETDRHRLDGNGDGIACQSLPGAP